MHPSEVLCRNSLVRKADTNLVITTRELHQSGRAMLHEEQNQVNIIGLALTKPFIIITSYL